MVHLSIRDNERSARLDRRRCRWRLRAGNRRRYQQPRDIAGQVADGRCVVIDGAVHMVNMEKPAEFNVTVLNFLREVNNL